MDETQRDLNEEGRKLWDQKAEFWDNLQGDEGNIFQRTLISPAVERLLKLEAGEKVLDVACGNGVTSRRLASLGGQVTAVDYSAAMLEQAKQRDQNAGDPIQYRIVDATDENALVALGEGEYDAIVSTMALMDMVEIAPLFRAVRRLLNANGRFVFATMHPAFNSNNPVFVVEKSDTDGVLSTTCSVKLSAYLELAPVLGVGAPNEPTAHYYYHRPLHELLGDAFEAGLVLDGLEEPAFPSDMTGRSGKGISWLDLPQIPPVMAGRMRICG